MVKLCTFHRVSDSPSDSRAGVLVDGGVVDLHGFDGALPTDLRALLEMGEIGLAASRKAVRVVAQRAGTSPHIHAHTYTPAGCPKGWVSGSLVQRTV